MRTRMGSGSSHHCWLHAWCPESCGRRTARGQPCHLTAVIITAAIIIMVHVYWALSTATGSASCKRAVVRASGQPFRADGVV